MAFERVVWITRHCEVCLKVDLPRSTCTARLLRPSRGQGPILKLTRKQFEAMTLEHLDTLYRVARRLTRDPGRAEDLVQETCVRAIRAYESFELHAHGIRPWLLRIMHNLHISRSEREARQPTAAEHDQLESAAPGGGITPVHTTRPASMAWMSSSSGQSNP